MGVAYHDLPLDRRAGSPLVLAGVFTLRPPSLATGNSRETRGKLRARAEIRDRPTVVDERRRFGDWEGDTVVGKARRGG